MASMSISADEGDEEEEEEVFLDFLDEDRKRLATSGSGMWRCEARF
jgi:hypothetical protein